MPLYLVITSNENADLSQVIDEGFPRQQDREKVIDGVWIVRSKHLTSSDVAKDLKFDLEHSDRSGIVAPLKSYSGIGPGSLVEKLKAWETEE